MGLLVILSAIILWVYFYNRKKYHNLKHQIPATVVKNYLDSIIQNSTALKSSLFRGGGLDVDPSSIPSVMPLDQLPTTSHVSVDGGGDEALKAEVARLQSELSAKLNVISDLETKNADLEGTVKAKEERIEELEKLLAEAQANAGSGDGDGDAATQAQLIEVTAERDRLKEDLAQYDIIEDDLADLKRLKQENELLKSALEAGGGSAPEVAPPVEEPAAVAEPTEPEPVAEPAAEEEAPAAEAAAVEEPAAEAPTDDKSPEDLLREFEKMLG